MKKLLILLSVGLMSCTFTFKNSNAEIIEYQTYDLGTQEDLYNGLEDNKKIIATGTLEFPLSNKCKDIFSRCQSATIKDRPETDLNFLEFLKGKEHLLHRLA